MKALIDSHQVSRPTREAADALWEALRTADLVADKTKEPLCGPSHIRNSFGGHGLDPTDPTPAPPGLAALTVQAAAAAISYLASLLP